MLWMRVDRYARVVVGVKKKTYNIIWGVLCMCGERDVYDVVVHSIYMGDESVL